jgi:hypothetical protein
MSKRLSDSLELVETTSRVRFRTIGRQPRSSEKGAVCFHGQDSPGEAKRLKRDSSSRSGAAPDAGLLGMGAGALIGAGAGFGMGMSAYRRGAANYPGPGMNESFMGPSTQMSLLQIEMLRSDIARLHRPIRGMGY